MSVGVIRCRLYRSDDIYPGLGLNAGIAIHSPRFRMQAKRVMIRIAVYAVINEERCLTNVLSQSEEGRMGTEEAHFGLL